MVSVTYYRTAEVGHNLIEPQHEKTCFLHMQIQRRKVSLAVTVKLIGTFVFATKIV